MGRTIRCPSQCCWSSYDTADLACDGYFRCTHCGEAMSRAEFIRMLNEIDAELVKWRGDIAALLASPEVAA